MADNLTQSDPNHHKEVALQAEEAAVIRKSGPSSASPSVPDLPIIWTPRFIIIFFLVLVLGLSIASILTRGWLNAYYPAGWLLIAYTVVNLGGWISVSIYARSPWVRSGGLFGCLWAILMGITFAVTVVPIDPDTIILLHATMAASTALLGSFLCLSMARTPLQRWGRAFFLLAPIIGAIMIIIVVFLIIRGTTNLFFLLEQYSATVESWTCTAIWWLRLSCWKTQPGLTFLLGIAPVIQLTLMQPVNSASESAVFFSQVMLLSILLGTLRILQYELRH